MSISAIVMLIVAILIIWGGLGLAMLNLHRNPDLPAYSWRGITVFYAGVERAEGTERGRELFVLGALGLLLLFQKNLRILSLYVFRLNQRNHAGFRIRQRGGAVGAGGA